LPEKNSGGFSFYFMHVIWLNISVVIGLRYKFGSSNNNELLSAEADSSVQVFPVPLTSDIASLSPLRLAKTSEPPPRLRVFHSLASVKELYSSFRAHMALLKHTDDRS
jgi:hypothetical protein